MAQLKDLLKITDNNKILLDCISPEKTEEIEVVSHYVDEYGEYVEEYIKKPINLKEKALSNK